MTTQAIDRSSATMPTALGSARPRPGARFGANRTRPAERASGTVWSAQSARGCRVARPAMGRGAGPAAATAGLQWTDRGIAVMLALVTLVMVVLVGTLVAAFLAVSNDPLPAEVRPAGQVALAGVQA